MKPTIYTKFPHFTPIHFASMILGGFFYCPATFLTLQFTQLYPSLLAHCAWVGKCSFRTAYSKKLLLHKPQKYIFSPIICFCRRRKHHEFLLWNISGQNFQSNRVSPIWLRRWSNSNGSVGKHSPQIWQSKGFCFKYSEQVWDCRFLGYHFV